MLQVSHSIRVRTFLIIHHMENMPQPKTAGEKEIYIICSYQFLARWSIFEKIIKAQFDLINKECYWTGMKQKFNTHNFSIVFSTKWQQNLFMISTLYIYLMQTVQWMHRRLAFKVLSHSKFYKIHQKFRCLTEVLSFIHSWYVYHIKAVVYPSRFAPVGIICY